LIDLTGSWFGTMTGRGGGTQRGARSQIIGTIVPCAWAVKNEPKRIEQKLKKAKSVLTRINFIYSENRRINRNRERFAAVVTIGERRRLLFLATDFNGENDVRKNVWR
jgi:hypothetical protein